MTSIAYYSSETNPAYLRLLHFARISKGNSSDYADDQIRGMLHAINSLPKFKTPVHSLLPLIYRKAVKTGIFKEFQTQSQSYLKQNALILVAAEMADQHWLMSTLELFEKHDLSVILLKGAAFANNLYPPDAPRRGVDLDFLVRKDDFEKACDILKESMDPVVLADDRLATHATLFERMFVSRDQRAPTVEIHRGLTNPYIFSIDEQTLWDTSLKHPAYDSERVRILSPEDTLLHLATHAFRDLNFCTHNLLDTHETICQQDVDTELLFKRASAWGATRVLYYLLYNSRVLMETPIEQELLSRLEPNHIINRINKKILQRTASQDHFSLLRYRANQLGSQILFPDKLINAIKFQGQYAVTRFKDLFSH